MKMKLKFYLKSKLKKIKTNIDFVNTVAEKNVEMTIADIRSNSDVLAEMEQQGEIKIVGGMYDISTGLVHFH